MKAFSRMCLELNVVGDASTEQRRNGDKYSENHILAFVGSGRVRNAIWMQRNAWAGPFRVGTDTGPRNPFFDSCLTI